MEETPEKLIERISKVKKNAGNPLIRLFIYLEKIKTSDQFDDYLKKNFILPLFDFVLMTLLITPLVIYICLSALTLSIHPTNFVFAEGISISWFILVSLKQDLWRKE